MAPLVPRKVKTPKETTQGGRAGARGTTEESTKTQNPLPPLCVHLCVGLPHRESCELFCGKLVVHGLGLTFSRRSFREEASLETFKPVLGVVPVRLEKYRSGAAAHRSNSSSIFARPYTTDLGQRSKLGSERRGGVEISTMNARHRKLPQSAENPQRS